MVQRQTERPQWWGMCMSKRAPLQPPTTGPLPGTGTCTHRQTHSAWHTHAHQAAALVPRPPHSENLKPLSTSTCATSQPDPNSLFFPILQPHCASGNSNLLPSLPKAWLAATCIDWLQGDPEGRCLPVQVKRSRPCILIGAQGDLPQCWMLLLAAAMPLGPPSLLPQQLEPTTKMLSTPKSSIRP